MAPRRGSRGRRPRRRICSFCADGAKSIDYKDIDKLRRYLSERGKILPRRVTANCSFHHRMMTQVLTRASMVALLPYIID